MATPQLVPDGFMGKILQEFGIQWTHVAILSGIGFSSFGLNDYLHPGVWILGTVAAFSLVYFFRRQLSPRFPIVSLGAIPVLVLAVCVPVFLIGRSGGSIAPFVAENRTAATVYLSFVIITPLACMIGSYRKQEDIYGGEYPAPLKDAIRSCIAGSMFYREDQEYRLTLLAADRDVIKVKTELEYRLVNRSRIEQSWTGGFVSPAMHAVYMLAEVDGRRLDVDDPDYQTERGLQVSVTLAPHGRVSLKFVAEETFAQNGSELYTAYIPATSLKLDVSNSFADIVRITVESLLPQKVLPSYEQSSAIYKTPTGVLPYQGFRLYWRSVVD